MTARRSIWLRWSVRDLRHHWAAVLTIAAVIAIGTGVYAGLGSTSAWRRLSNDQSFAALRMHDLRVELSPGTFLDSGRMRELALGIPHADGIEAADERLVVSSTVDASTSEQTVLVTARIVGADYGAGAIDDVWVDRGESFISDGAASQGRPTAVLEQKFADYYGLPETGTVELAGGLVVEYTGVGVAPEEFYVVGPEGSILAEADLATLYMATPTAQRLAGHEGEMNDLVIDLAPGADRDVVEAELATTFAPVASATVTTRDEAEAYRVLYEDIENDEQVWNALSALVLGAAALASFNLISRIVESQRREIGIGMALGVSRRRLAIRPVMIGAQVGVIGTLAGIGTGFVIGGMMQGLLRSLLPLPRWVMPFQYDVFLRGAVFGLLPPLAAALIPVWRAVRVEPIEAIRTGHLARVSGRLGSWTRRVRVPGSSLAQMPLRNLLRAPRRTVLTALGVGAAITALVAVLGMLDSFERAIDRGAAEVTRGDPERVTVVLDGFHSTDSAIVSDIAGAPEVGAADPTLRIPATVTTAGAAITEPNTEIDIELVVELLDFDSALWTPTIVAGSGRAGAAPDGLVLAEKAARDLGVAPGDTVALTHPQRTGLGFAMVESRVVVAAIHPNPIRNFAFLDASFADDFGLDGLANGVQVTPAPGFDRRDLQRALFGAAGVASAQPVARVGEVFDEAMAQFVGFLFITAGAVLVLALLIAFNSARISVEERRRDHATMLAFGIRVRQVVGVISREAVAIGLLATAIGTAAGLVVLRWILDSLAERTLPDFDVPPALSPTTLLTAVAVGVLSVSLAPLFLIGRIRRMDLPDTLRVME